MLMERMIHELDENPDAGISGAAGNRRDGYPDHLFRT